MMARLLSVLSGWKAKLLAVAVGLAALGTILLRAYLAGKAAARSAADRARLKAMRKRKEIDDDVAGLDHADLDERYSEYLRDRER